MNSSLLRPLTAVVVATYLVGSAPPDAYAAPSPRTTSSGTASDLGATVASASVVVPNDDAEAPIVGMAVSPYQDQVIVWYANETYTVGSSSNLEQHLGPNAFTTTDGHDPWEILSMAIDSRGHVFTWYTSGYVSEGIARDLDFYGTSLIQATVGFDRDSIVGMAMSKKDDSVTTYYADGTFSVGTPTDLLAFGSGTPYSLPGTKKIGHITDVALDTSGVTHAWYHDVESGRGHSSFVNEVDARAMDLVRRFRLPGLVVAASKDGRIVLKKGYGFSNFSTQTRMTQGRRCRIGSVSKIITALSAMHLEENNLNFDVTMPVYGIGGALPTTDYLSSQATGVERHQPIVAKAISPNGRVYTWYHDGTVTSGFPTAPDYYTGPEDYILPDNMSPEDVRAIAIDNNGDTWVWYEDKRYSRGTPTEFESIDPVDPKEKKKVKIPDLGIKNVLDVAFAANGNVYAYYDDGTRSIGSPGNFGNVSPRQSFSTGSQNRYDIVGIGIAKTGNKKAYAFYSNGVVTHGSSRNLAKTGTNNYLIPAYASDPNKDWYNWYQDMNVDHLMSHSSGFTNSGNVSAAGTMFFPNVADAGPLLSYQQVHDYMLRTRKLRFAPGSEFSYSNHGAGLVSHIVSQVSGMSFNDYARLHIIDYLGLNIRGNSGPQTSADTRRHRYNSDGELEAYTEDPNHQLGLGAGGWKSSMPDLVRLMLATDQLPNHPDILSPTTLNKMETQPYPGSSFARGWQSGGHVLSHSGATGGSNANIKKYGAVVFNQSGATPINIAVCTPIAMGKKDDAKLSRFISDLQRIIDDANIPANYDLY